MIKLFSCKKILITTLLLLVALILYSFPKELKEHINIKENNKNIYLIDDNNFVAMTKIHIDKNTINEEIENTIKSLTINNKEKASKNFKKTIPENTKLLNYKIEDNLLKINFSKEFLNLPNNNEIKVIESLIYSLTDIKGIDKIIIYVENEKLDKIPNTNIKLGLYLDRSFGINKIYDINNINNTKEVTTYYLSKNENEYYYIPVTLITNSNESAINIIIKNLKTTPVNNQNLISHLNYQIELTNYEINEQEIILSFNENILSSIKDGYLKEEVKYAISYSISDTLNIKDIIFIVNNKKIDEFNTLWLAFLIILYYN